MSWMLAPLRNPPAKLAACDPQCCLFQFLVVQVYFYYYFWSVVPCLWVSVLGRRGRLKNWKRTCFVFKTIELRTQHCCLVCSRDDLGIMPIILQHASFCVVILSPHEVVAHPLWARFILKRDSSVAWNSTSRCNRKSLALMNRSNHMQVPNRTPALRKVATPN